MDFGKFIATRTIVADVTMIEGYGYEDQFDKGTSGFLYNGDNLFIQQVSPLNFGESITDGDYHVELFGDDFRGSLSDCEVELYAAATRERVLES